MAHKYPGLKISLRAHCVLDKGMVFIFSVLLPPQNWSRGVLTDTQGCGVPSLKFVQGTRKSLSLQIVCPSIFLLSLAFFCHLEKSRCTSSCWCRNQQGWDAASPTFLLSLFCGWETSHSKRNGRRKIKTGNMLLEHSWGLPSSQAIMGKSTQWWNYRVREN